MGLFPSFTIFCRLRFIIIQKEPALLLSGGNDFHYDVKAEIHELHGDVLKKLTNRHGQTHHFDAISDERWEFFSWLY